MNTIISSSGFAGSFAPIAIIRFSQGKTPVVSISITSGRLVSCTRGVVGVLEINAGITGVNGTLTGIAGVGNTKGAGAVVGGGAGADGTRVKVSGGVLGGRNGCSLVVTSSNVTVKPSP